MIKNTIKSFLVVSFFCSVALLFILPVFDVLGQEGSSGVRLQPTLIEGVVDPGSTFNSSLKVTNVSDSERTFYFIAKDITSLTTEGTPIFAEEGEATEHSLSSWIKVNVTSINLGPDETREVPFSVSVPKDASPGGHFAGLFVSLQPSEVQGIGTGVGYQVATIISLQIAGDITEEARIREFATGKFIYSKAEVDFKTVVENMGNVLVRARGPLEITDIWGKKVATLVVNDQGAVVLPSSNREFKTVWTGEGFNIGRYQAVLGLVYGNEGKKTITSTTSFWVLPLNFILMVLVGVIVFIVLFFTISHLYIRSRLAKIGSDKAGSYSGRGGSFKGIVVSLILLVGVAIFIFLLMFFFA